MTNEYYFTNPYKTYLEEKFKEEDHGTHYREADGRLVPKANGYHKWNGSGYDWIAPTPMRGGFQRPTDGMKPRPAPRTAPTNVIFQKAADILGPRLQAQADAKKAELAAIAQAKIDVAVERQQRNIIRAKRIKDKEVQIKKDKGWFGEGVMDKRGYDAREPDKIPHHDKGSVFDKMRQLPNGEWVPNKDLKPRPRYLYGVHDDTTWNIDAKKDKETVHENLFMNPFKTIS